MYNIIITSILFLYRAGSKKHAGRLNIYGTPTARDFPVDLKAVEGREFILHCPMGGYPLGKYYLHFFPVKMITYEIFMFLNNFFFIFRKGFLDQRRCYNQPF